MRRQARARYGTGDFLQLNKRDCGTSIELIPCGACFLKVVWKIGDDNHVFWASSVMNYQFYSFIRAIYELYGEGNSDAHNHSIGSRKEWRRFSYNLETKKSSVETYCVLDGEGILYKFFFRREEVDDIAPDTNEADPVSIRIVLPDNTEYRYVIDGKDLCYAVAKAYTEVLKKFGFYGYYTATAGDSSCSGDVIPIYMFLFIKAYGLMNMEARELRDVPGCRWEDDRTVAGSFERELELLLFDM